MTSFADFSFYTDAKITRIEDAIVGIEHIRGHDLWTRRTLRKPTKCAHCRAVLNKGAQAYAPITNRDHRGDRLCRQCVEAA